MQYSLVIFDMDGTVLDTLKDLAAAVNAALRTSGMPEHTLEEVRQFVGNGIGKLIERAVPAGATDTEREQVFQAFTAYYKAHCTEQTAPYPGIPALLEELRASGIKTAVVSNKADYGVQALAKAFFPGLLDAAVGERPGVRRKPAPDAVQAVLQALGIAREEAVYVGDSDVDIQTARNAGIPCISVDWGYRTAAFLRENGAERIVSTAEELRACLLKK